MDAPAGESSASFGATTTRPREPHPTRQDGPVPPPVFMVARNPDPDSTLPFLIRLPLGPNGLVLKARDSWPRTAKVYCHRAEHWPADAEIVEEVPVKSCVRKGVAVDLVLARGRENRSQIVFTRLKGGREGIFWQSPRTTKKARPGVRTPTRRASYLDDFTIHVDTRERYPYKFANQQVATERTGLPVGDYGVVVDGDVIASVERKSLDNLVKGLVEGTMQYQLADLATLPHAAVVVEDRYSAMFKVERVQPGWLAELLAHLQVRFTNVPIVFCETRPLAEEWTYRFLGAALATTLAQPDDPTAPRDP